MSNLSVPKVLKGANPVIGVSVNIWKILLYSFSQTILFADILLQHILLGFPEFFPVCIVFVKRLAQVLLHADNRLISAVLHPLSPKLRVQLLQLQGPLPVLGPCIGPAPV